MQDMKIKEAIDSVASNVEIVGKITKMEIDERAKRSARHIRSAGKAILEDDTGSIILVLWSHQVKQCQVGNVIRVTGAAVATHSRRGRGPRLPAPQLSTVNDIEVIERK
jgi:ssDNA-binding replication factor A large subunit